VGEASGHAEWRKVGIMPEASSGLAGAYRPLGIDYAGVVIGRSCRSLLAGDAIKAGRYETDIACKQAPTALLFTIAGLGRGDEQAYVEQPPCVGTPFDSAEKFSSGLHSGEDVSGGFEFMRAFNEHAG
jgi:hypothetical protein